MTPGTLVLLHDPIDRAAAWGGVPEILRSYGLDVIAPDIPGMRGAGYVARAALIITATAPTSPLVLVGHGEAGPLLPLIGAAQRAAHRTVGAYVFIDAGLPEPAGRVIGVGIGSGPRPGAEPDPGGGTGVASGPGSGSGGRLLPPADWPDAPCGFLGTSAAYERQARQASLRGWQVAMSDPVSGLAQAVHKMVVTL